VKPDRSLSSIEPSSVRKKMKDKAFARTVQREDLINGARDLGVELDEHIRFVADALKPVAHQLGVNP
jgi:predicted hydrolase (HD superfamily)